MTLLAFTPRRIAVVRMLQLGDMLVAIPALRALRAGFPRAEMTLIGLPWAESFAHHYKGYVDRFVAFPGYPGIAEAPYDAERTNLFLAAQRAHGYDLVVQMHGSGGDSNPFAAPPATTPGRARRTVSTRRRRIRMICRRSRVAWAWPGCLVALTSAAGSSFLLMRPTAPRRPGYLRRWDRKTGRGWRCIPAPARPPVAGYPTASRPWPTV